MDYIESNASVINYNSGALQEDSFTGECSRQTGIEIIGEVPWGSHFCQFYQTQQDLIDVLVPYFKAGLESNEFCMWVTSDPLGVEEAAQALCKAVPDLDRRISEGQIEIIPHTEWYLLDGVFDQQRVLDGWVCKLNAAAARGYEGLRLTGNTFWLEKSDWQDFTDYEEAVNSTIDRYRMLALCTYSVDKCGASEIADVVANHEFALMKRLGKWTVIESSTVRQTKQALQGALDELRCEIEERERAEEDLEQQRSLLATVTANTQAHLVYLDRDFNFIWVNPAYAEACARTQAELIGRNHFELFPHEENRAIFERVRDTGEAFHVREKPFEYKDHPEWGVTYWDWTLTPVKNSEGTVQSLVFTLMDVTHDVRARQEIERLRAEAEQHAAELESFITSMSDAVVLVDSEGGVILSNRAGHDIVGANPHASIRERVSQCRVRKLDGTPVGVEDTATYKALHGEIINEIRHRIITQSGKDMVVSVSSSPVLADGRIIGASSIFRDVTDQYEFEMQKQELYDREHHIAEMLQQAIIPPNVPTELYGYQIAVKYRPALREAEIGGDFYDIFELGDNKIGVLIGDVAGKGLPAAIRVAAARHAIRSYAYLDPRPARVMTLANEALCRDLGDESQILTAFFAVVDTDLGAMTYTSAGHEPPLICSKDGICEELEIGGMPIGILEDNTYTQTSRRMDAGDICVMITDGITEARTEGSILFEKRRVADFLRRNHNVQPEEIASGLVLAAETHAGGQLQDDAAVVVLGPCSNKVERH